MARSNKSKKRKATTSDNSSHPVNDPLQLKPSAKAVTDNIAEASEEVAEHDADENPVNSLTVAALPHRRTGDDDDDDSSDDDDDEDDLVLEGVIIRNPDVSDSDDTTTSGSDEDEDDDHDHRNENSKQKSKKRKVGDSDKKEQAQQRNKKQQTVQSKAPNKTNAIKTKQKTSGPEIVNVEFTFCDMDEQYFHGLKTLLTACCPAVYGAHSSTLADVMIDNISVGTIVSTEGDVDGTVFGFASVVNITTYQQNPGIQDLKQLCLQNCPKQRHQELSVVLSGTTKRPAGFLFHGRMVNMPLEVVEVMHQQLILDLDWAVKEADGCTEDEKKALDFGAMIRIAPTYRSGGSDSNNNISNQVSYYKFFDDEIFAQHAEFTYEIDLSKSGLTNNKKTHQSGQDEDNETPYCMVIVMTKTGHRAAMKDMAQMVNGTGK